MGSNGSNYRPASKEPCNNSPAGAVLVRMALATRGVARREAIRNAFIVRRVWVVAGVPMQVFRVFVRLYVTLFEQLSNNHVSSCRAAPAGVQFFFCVV